MLSADCLAVCGALALPHKEPEASRQQKKKEKKKNTACRTRNTQICKAELKKPSALFGREAKVGQAG